MAQLILCPTARSATVADGRQVSVKGLVTGGVAAQVAFFAEIDPTFVHLKLAPVNG